LDVNRSKLLPRYVQFCGLNSWVLIAIESKLPPTFLYRSPGKQPVGNIFFDSYCPCSVALLRKIHFSNVNQSA
jgi:hypothetical protein